MYGLYTTNSRNTRGADGVSTLPQGLCTPRCDVVAVFSVNHVPVEILAEIFLYCGITDPDIRDPPYFPVTPLILSQVCNHWRDVTLTFPTLWSSILVYYPRRRHVPMVKLWLDRSSTCPLSLTLLQHRDPSYEQHKLTDEILSLFISHVSRWREIDFKLYEKIQHPLLAVPSGAAKDLQSASLDLESFDRDSTDKIWRTIYDSPVLRRANWWRSYGYKGMPTHVPWPQLTHITLHPNLTVDALLDILQMCQAVQLLEVYSLNSTSIFPPRAPLVVPTLHAVMICALPHTATLLNHLALPSLHSLSIRHHGQSEPYDAQPIHDFLERSSCDLKKLFFNDLDIAEGDLLSLLKSPRLASLMELGIVAHITNTTATSLARRFVGGDDECLLPNLESISFRTCHTSDGVVSAMIASRFGPGTPLKAVKLRMGGPSSICDFALLRRMRESGLSVDAFSSRSMLIAYKMS